jgi:hypothetical protein
VVTLLLGGVALAQTSCLQVDHHGTQTPRLFPSLWQTAKTQTAWIALLDYSQEINPAGHESTITRPLEPRSWLSPRRR